MKPKWKDELSVKENAQSQLPRLAKAFFRAGRKAAECGRVWKQLHQFRLATKEFRYTLESFQPLYGKELDERLDALRKVQSTLGEMNDRVAGLKLLKEMDGPSEIRDRLKRDRDKQLREFHRYWRKFGTSEEADEWATYLKNGIKSPPQRARGGRRKPATRRNSQ